MFGRMTIAPVLEINPETNLETAVAALVRKTETAEIVRWIEFQLSVLLFLLVPGDPESGAVYVLDRKKGTWYAVDFDDQHYGGYSAAELETLLTQCNFLTLVERPGLWRSGLKWVVTSGTQPEARV